VSQDQCRTWGSYRTIASIFKWLALALLAYIGAALFAHPNGIEVLKGTFIPHLSWSGSYLATLVGILGTTISPYMFFWQATQEVEEDMDVGRVYQWQRKGTTDAELKYASWDINAGMLFSNLVMYFIILATAATLFKSGHTHISTAADAARALEPIAGKAAGILLALGMIGAGFLAIPILIGSSAYAISEVFGWLRLEQTSWASTPVLYNHPPRHSCWDRTELRRNKSDCGALLDSSAQWVSGSHFAPCDHVDFQ